MRACWSRVLCRLVFVVIISCFRARGRKPSGGNTHIQPQAPIVTEKYASQRCLQFTAVMDTRGRTSPDLKYEFMAISHVEKLVKYVV